MYSKLKTKWLTGFNVNTSIPNASGYHYWIVSLAPDVLATTNFETNAMVVYPNLTATILTIQNPNTILFDKVIIVMKTSVNQSL